MSTPCRDQALEVAVSSRLVGRSLLPHAPHDAQPSSPEHADRVRVVAPPPSRSDVDVAGPWVVVAGRVGEAGARPAGRRRGCTITSAPRRPRRSPCCSSPLAPRTSSRCASIARCARCYGGCARASTATASSLSGGRPPSCPTFPDPQRGTAARRPLLRPRQPGGARLRERRGPNRAARERPARRVPARHGRPHQASRLQ